jgi:hypothetical protein
MHAMHRSSTVAFFDEKLCAFVDLKRSLRDPIPQLGNRLPRAALIAFVAALVMPSQPVIAAEGGSGFYLLGQRGPGAAALPTVEGVFFSMPSYYYSGDVSGSQPLEVGGAATLGLDLDLKLIMPTALWMTPVDFLGGDLGFSATFVYGNADLSANLAVSIPEIGDFSFDDSDDRWATGDPVASAFLGWNGENYAYTLTSTVNIPAGDYDVGRLSNVSVNYWAADVTAAGTWLFPQSQVELSGATGFTFNDENDDTKYETGTEFHLEAAAYYQFSTLFSAGLNGYYYNQMSGDSGEGAVLGNLEGEVAAIGPGFSGTFMVGSAPVSVSFRYYHEFSAENRLEGDAAWLTLFVPLWVPDRN